MRSRWLRRGFLLALATIGWNVVEGGVAVAAGAAAGSIALVGFGIDSFIETASAALIAWRLQRELRGAAAAETARIEARTARVAGALLLLLAGYVLVDAARRLAGAGARPEESAVGIALTVLSLIVMPLLARAKLRVAHALASRSLRTDAYETVACAWLSATTLAGLAFNAAWGWWWADPLAAWVLVPLIAREGLEGWRDPVRRYR